MRRSWQGGWFTAVLAALPLLAASEEAAPPAPGEATVNAVWVEREVSFTYQPLSVYYSCDGLRDKIHWMLGELGARPGFRVASRGCTRTQGAEPFPGVEIVASFAQEATPELLRQLADRGAGSPQPDAAATARFPAQAKRVEFNSSLVGLGGLQEGDCDLIEQLLRNGVFEKLGVKVVDRQVNCVERQTSLLPVRLTVEVLEPVEAR